MPISKQTGFPNRYNAQNPQLKLPVLNEQGAEIPGDEGVYGLSFPFTVLEQPVTLVGSGFVDGVSPDIVIVQCSPDGVTWQDLWIHGFPIQLEASNSMVVLTVPGTYRLRRFGAGG